MVRWEEEQETLSNVVTIRVETGFLRINYHNYYHYNCITYSPLSPNVYWDLAGYSTYITY